VRERARPGAPEPFQRKDGRWCVAVQLGVGSRQYRKRTYLYGSSKTEVTQRRDELRDAQRAGGRPADRRLSVGAFARAWLDGLQVRRRTEESYRSTMERHVLPSLGSIALSGLSAVEVREMSARLLRDGVGRRTVAYALTVLRVALNQALRDGLIARNPATSVARPKPAVRRPVYMDAAAAVRFMDAIVGDRLEALYLVAMATGLRRGELLGTFWSDVDLENRQLTIRRALVYRPGDAYEFDAPKTDRARRVVPLPMMAVEALRLHESRQKRERLAAGPSWQGDPKAPLMFATKTGRPLAGATVTHALTRHLKRAELPHQRLHDLRHGYASILLAEGVSMRTIQELLGHTTMSTTSDIYTHIAPAPLDAADAFDRALDRARKTAG
jgi:integrase